MLGENEVASLVVMVMTVVVGTSSLVVGITVVVTVVSSVFEDVTGDVVSKVVVETSSVVVGFSELVGVVLITVTVARSVVISCGSDRRNSNIVVNLVFQVEKYIQQLPTYPNVVRALIRLHICSKYLSYS